MVWLSQHSGRRPRPRAHQVACELDLQRGHRVGWSRLHAKTRSSLMTGRPKNTKLQVVHAGSHDEASRLASFDIVDHAAVCLIQHLVAALAQLPGRQYRHIHLRALERHVADSAFPSPCMRRYRIPTNP